MHPQAHIAPLPLAEQIEIEPYTLTNNALQESQKFYEKMALRRTIRRFSSEPIDLNVVVNAIKTAGTAPSGANRQPWYFALVTTKAIKIKIREAAEQVEEKFYTNKATNEWISDLKPFGTNSVKPYLTEAPALIAIFSRTSCESDNGHAHKTYYPIESTGIAVGLLIASLHSAGLATLTHTPRPMFFLNEILGLDKTYRPFMILVTGQPHRPVLVPQINRKNISEIMDEF